MNVNETINQRIAKCRKLANLTQQETAEKLGMKCSTYSQMERKGRISVDRALQLANILNVPKEYILYGGTNTPPLFPPQAPQDGIIDINQTPTPPVIVDPKPVDPTPSILLTKREENIIKRLRTLPKDAKEEIIALIESKYKK